MVVDGLNKLTSVHGDLGRFVMAALHPLELVYSRGGCPHPHLHSKSSRPLWPAHAEKLSLQKGPTQRKSVLEKLSNRFKVFYEN